MSKSFACGYCGSVFESDNLDPRCPKCLRISRISEYLHEQAEQKTGGEKRYRQKSNSNMVQGDGSSTDSPNRYSWLLPVGTAMTAIGLIAILSLVYTDCREEKYFGEAVFYAVLGGGGLGLIVISLLRSRIG